MKLHFAGKTALVTGAASGIGTATALLFAAYGAKVIVSDTSEKGGLLTVAKIRSRNGDATFIKSDLSSPVACERLIEAAADAYGSIDIACNNARIAGESRYLAHKALEAFDSEEDSNLDSLFYCMKYEIEAMQRQTGGVIINITPIAGALGLVAFNPYVNVKYGIVELMQNTPGKNSPGSIRINAVTPAFMNKTLLEEIHSMEKPASIKLSPIGRLDKMEEAATLIVWLSSDKVLSLPPFRGNN